MSATATLPYEVVVASVGAAALYVGARILKRVVGVPDHKYDQQSRPEDLATEAAMVGLVIAGLYVTARAVAPGFRVVLGRLF